MAGKKMSIKPMMKGNKIKGMKDNPKDSPAKERMERKMGKKT